MLMQIGKMKSGERKKRRRMRDGEENKKRRMSGDDDAIAVLRGIETETRAGVCLRSCLPALKHVCFNFLSESGYAS